MPLQTPQGHTVIAWARSADLLGLIASDRIHVQVVDLLDTAALPARVKALLVAYPLLSGLINNAAIQVERDLIDTTAAQVQQELAINLTAPIVLSQLLVPQLKKQPDAFICNISSALALAAKRSSAVYCASKAGLHIFSDSVRAQLAGTGVQLTEVLPPTVETRMTAHRSVPKMAASDVARLTIAAIVGRKRSVLLGKGKLLGVLLYLAPPLAKKIMLKF
jgi:uncharacterized oxidoreductase